MFDSYIRAVKENGKLIFPEDFCISRETEEDDNKKSLEEIEATLGPYLYAGNYYNNPVSDDLVEFKDEWFQQYRFDEMSEQLRSAKCVISIDPATKDKEANDPSGFVVSKIVDDGGVYLQTAYKKKLLPNKLVEEVFNLVDIYNPDVVTIETVSAQILWIPLFNYEMKKRNKHFKLEEYDPGTKVTKPIKIRKLIPYYARGQVFHKKGMTELEKQLREFPRNKEDDIIDALQAQIKHWKSTTVVVRKPLIKYTEAWWAALRSGNRHSGMSPEESLFEEYRSPNKTIIREPKW